MPLDRACPKLFAFEIMDLVTLKIVFKFASVLSSGLYFGGCVYSGKTHVPGLLAVKDLTQSVLSFQYFWPRCRHDMLLSCLTAGLCGIMVYFIEHEKEELPWLGTGLVMLSMIAYTTLVIYPYSIKQLLEMKNPGEKQEKEIVSLFKKFSMFHHLRTAVGAACFLSFAYYLYCT